jgi:ATP-dependent DNA helicase DinG
VTTLLAPIEEIFAPTGPIARTVRGFETRSGQVAMAHMIERGFSTGAHTIVEAGTGVGKSFAYLVPALRSGKKVVLSTGTIALQEQLVRKDIPLMLQALGGTARVELLKGRSQYLCRSKLEQMRVGSLLAPSLTMEQAWKWAEATRSGDRGELPHALPGYEWELLDADADDCVGDVCEHFRDCWFFGRREAARYADITVVNHALFFLDLALGGGILPAYDVAILDEAHQCEQWATAALTASISQASVARLLRRLHRAYRVPTERNDHIDQGMRSLLSALARIPGERYALAENEEAQASLLSLREALYGLENWLLAEWKSALKHPPDTALEAERRRDNALRGVVEHIAAIDRMSQADDEMVTWVECAEKSKRYAVNAAPYDVAAYLRAQLFDRTHSVVLTSATIADGNGFGLLRETLGIDEAQEYIAPSPFDYPAQACVYTAPARCNPKNKDFASRVAPIVEEILDITAGRAFVLFTSYARLREIRALLPDLPFPVKMQGDIPRAHLLDWFRSTKNAVLFGTGSFWEGIDVVGEQLSCVIIDRLPFPSPGEPIVAARIAAIEAAGRSGFAEYMIPSAIMRLKQGFGRLIRSRSDRGVVAILDGRITGMPYGRKILAALPPARRTTELDDLRRFFHDDALRVG